MCGCAFQRAMAGSVSARRLHHGADFTIDRTSTYEGLMKGYEGLLKGRLPYKPLILLVYEGMKGFNPKKFLCGRAREGGFVECLILIFPLYRNVDPQALHPFIDHENQYLRDGGTLQTLHKTLHAQRAWGRAASLGCSGASLRLTGGFHALMPSTSGSRSNPRILRPKSQLPDMV
jgi:hypothetical protein